MPPYLRTDDDPGGVGGPVWFSELGFDRTRPFRALEVWMMLKHLGLAGYRELIARDIAIAGTLAAGVEAGLDELNRLVLTGLQLGGRVFLAGTTLDGRFALRACVVNPGTAESDVDALIAETVRLTVATR